MRDHVGIPTGNDDLDRLSTLRLLTRVIELGSFTRAAHELGLGQPSVSKQIGSLEAHLGTRLLERTSRGLRPTAAGLDLYHSARRLISDLEETEARIRDGSTAPSGLVRVATPPVLGRMYIIPSLPSFLAQFPQIEVEFTAGQPFADLVKDGVDVALRVGELGSSGLIARKIGEMQMITVASPDYLARHGTPADLRDLARHKLIAAQTGGRAIEWRFSGEEGTVAIMPTSAFRSNDGEDLRAAVLAGIGILHGPGALFHADLEAGRIVRILEAYKADTDPIHLVTPGGRKMPYRVRVFIDFLAATFASQPGLQIP
ncbi:LysR family transcriptional regulator [Novosphingobium sp. PhB165]|uniref:LysR family transcriptional regulator n=1 Tax=Novosphingobium sp. PhB165 TaxID=2485105 RepID=UPI0010DC4477|nr:LysR family transcriptional regulator [Novosphingobium sp. PhB165]TCM20344.1 LysR family transcriptional regulator [Novosphingobium sp. PhB165]